jgi:hypothetical protein
VSGDDAVLRFARHGTAPSHWYTAYVYPTTEPDFYSATGAYRIEAGATADGHLLGYRLTYTPLSGGGEIPARRQDLGWEGGFGVAKETCARHLRAMLAEADSDRAVVVL